MAGCTCATCEGARAYSRAQKGSPARLAAYKRYRAKPEAQQKHREWWHSLDEMRLAGYRSRKRAYERAQADARDAARCQSMLQGGSR